LSDEELTAEFGKIGAQFEKLDRTFAGIREYLLEFRGEMIDRLERLERQQRITTELVSGIESRLPPLTRGVLEVSTDNISLANRVSALEKEVAQLKKPAA
jgi:hypothetical protein